MKTETIEDFYNRIAPGYSLGSNYKPQQFNVQPRNYNCGTSATAYNRRDFYKISLVIGEGTLYYANKGIKIDRPALMFSNPMIPYSWEPSSEDQSGYFCLFTEGFIHTESHQNSVLESPLFKVGSNPVFFLDEKQQEKVNSIYESMMQEIETEYLHKTELLRSYVHLLIHEAMKMQPAQNYFKHANATSRITNLFLELLERQFPIDTPKHYLSLKTPNDFALKLSVHVNHLNRAVKQITGKTTGLHIADRVMAEAKALLKHTDWNVAEIANCLGFEYPAYFNNFFKKHALITPSTFRVQ